MIYRVFMKLLCVGNLFLILSIFPSNQAIALDFEVHKFKQCIYTIKNCECCRKVDIIDSVYNGYANDDRLYISENDNKKEVVFLRYKYGERAKSNGYLTFVLQKSATTGEWREVLAERSIGGVSRAYFGQYPGAFCLQVTPEKGKLFVRSDGRYLHQKNISNVRCIDQSSASIKKLFNPK